MLQTEAKTLNTFVQFYTEKPTTTATTQTVVRELERRNSYFMIKQQTKWTSNLWRRSSAKKRQTCTHRKLDERERPERRKLWNVRHHLSIQIVLVYFYHFFGRFVNAALGRDREFYLFRNERTSTAATTAEPKIEMANGRRMPLIDDEEWRWECPAQFASRLILLSVDLCRQFTPLGQLGVPQSK